MVSVKVSSLILIECLIFLLGNTSATRLSSRQLFAPSAFKYDMAAAPVSASNSGGSIRVVSVDEMPALEGEGVSFAHFTIKPCGINTPHVHPRATEILYVIKGSNLRTGFVEENGGRTIINDLSAGQVTVFPQGLIHYQQNLGCQEAQYISGLNSEDPGVTTVAQAVFGLPIEGVASTFDMSESDVFTIKSNIPFNPAKGRKECLKRCGLSGLMSVEVFVKTKK